MQSRTMSSRRLCQPERMSVGASTHETRVNGPSCGLHAQPGCGLPRRKAVLQSRSVLRSGEGATAGPEKVPSSRERSEKTLGGDGASEPPHPSLPNPSGLVFLLDSLVAP